MNTMTSRTAPIAVMLALSLLLISFDAHAETVRGELTSSLAPGDEGHFRLFELVAIPSVKNPIAKSVEVLLTIPRPFLRYRDSFALSLYGGLSTAPTEGMQQLQGRLLYQGLIPPSGKLLLRLPLSDELGQGGPGIILPDHKIAMESFPLILQIVPIMKGLPSELLSADIGISVDLLLEDVGFLTLSLELPEGVEKPLEEDTQFLIDNKRYAEKELTEKLKLSSGLHTLRLNIHGFAEENRTFNITKGETTVLAIAPELLESHYTISAPTGTVVFIDGKQLNQPIGEEAAISPGEHVVLFRFGDYQLSRKFTVNGGKNYNIELFFDILIEDH
ncbi:hypothetical protein [Sediminispirochaeta bajacaliforniensis]|uniref:hypothetical protein n=1 Tax=Sediminispirochaeta bajacaliforniensis TaxID=148 RepID=UPI00035C3243|nr:hypothetical protein [Sediminispirochaeta bajacaliforniensis]